MSNANLITAASFNGYDFEVARTGRIDGLTEASYDVSESVYAGVRGAIFNQALPRKRQITLEFLVMTNSEDNYETQRAAILEACNKANGEGELNLTLYGNDYLINAVPEPPIIDWPKFPYFTVQMQFTAYDPIIYSANAQSQTGIAVPAGGGLTFPLVFPLTFESSGSTGQVTIYNNGNIESYPILTITGLMTNPLIRNATTGETFQLTYTSTVNDTIVIDMAARTVTLNENTNLLGNVVDGSDWWTLTPGANMVALSTSSTADTGTLGLSWRDAFSGV